MRPTPLTSLERFPYYTAFPFAWYFAAYSADIGVGEVHTARWLARDLVIWRGEDGVAARHGRVLPAHGRAPRVRRARRGVQPRVPLPLVGVRRRGSQRAHPVRRPPNRKARVRSYPTVDRNGLIMFWYHPTGAAAAVGAPGAPGGDDPEWAGRAPRRVGRALPVAGDGRERSRLRAPPNRPRRGRGARGREPHVRRAVQPPALEGELLDARAARRRAASTPTRGDPASGSHASRGSRRRCSLP